MKPKPYIEVCNVCLSLMEGPHCLRCSSPDRTVYIAVEELEDILLDLHVRIKGL